METNRATFPRSQPYPACLSHSGGWPRTIGAAMKRCPKCGETKAHADFSKARDARRTGREPTWSLCKPGSGLIAEAQREGIGGDENGTDV